MHQMFYQLDRETLSFLANIQAYIENVFSGKKREEKYRGMNKTWNVSKNKYDQFE